MGYAPGLALDRRRVSRVSTNRLLSFLLCEDLLLVLLDHLVVHLLVDRHEIHQLGIYMHEMMMQCLVI